MVIEHLKIRSMVMTDDLYYNNAINILQTEISITSKEIKQYCKKQKKN